MILLILLLAIIAFAYFNIIPGKGHRFLAWISLAVLIVSVGSVVLHDRDHLGMEVETKTQTQRLVSSASPQLPILLYQPLGNGTEKVYIYKTNAEQKKPKPIKVDKMKATVTKSAAKPTVTIKTERYVFKNSTMKALFSVFNHENELKQRTYEFKLPKNWQVLSIKQAKALQKKLLQQQALLKQKAALAKQAQAAQQNKQ